MSTIRMWVESPEIRQTKGLLSKQVMTYQVIVDGAHMGGVRKRYSEFETLRMVLEKRYGAEGVLVPPLPPKKIVGNQENDFIKSRMTGLSLFCGGIAKSPFLMNDISTERFLTQHSEDLSIEDIDDFHNNEGYSKWTEFLSGFPLPFEPDAQLDKVKAELDLIEKNLKVLLEAGKTLTGSVAQYGRALQGLSQAAHVFADGEKVVKALNDTSSSALRSSSNGSHEEEEEEQQHVHHHHYHQKEPINSVPHLMLKTAESITGSVEGYIGAGEQLDLLFAEIIDYAILQIHTLRALLSGREELSSSILKLQRKLYGLQSTPIDRRDKFRPEFEMLQSKISKEEVRYYKYTKALLCYTIPYVARARNENLNRAFANLAAVTTSATSAAYFCSIRYLQEVNFDAGEIVDEANEEATRLIIPPIASIQLPPSPRPSTNQRLASPSSQQHQQHSSSSRIGERRGKGDIPSISTHSAPGSFLRPPSTTSAANTPKLADSILTAAIPGIDGRAPWDDDPDHVDPFAV